MAWTVVHPRDLELRSAVRLGIWFAVGVFAFHLAANVYQAHLGYGYFRDEFYYLVCGRRLAWGYVDHGPLVALQAHIAETLFGRSMAGIRSLSALAGAGRVFLTGLLAWCLGGRRPAQGLAMVGVAVASQYLGVDGFLSMNSAESLFWMTALLALLLVLRGGDGRWWLLFGAAAGLGLLNKPSMTFFLLALLGGLLLTPQRRVLASRWMAAGVLLMLLIVTPYLLWQVSHHWPTLEFLENGRAEHKNKVLAPVAFLVNQVLILNPLNALIWVPGLVFLLRQRERRFLGWTFLLFLTGMIALHAKDYYVTPIYPVLFAAGGVAWERRFWAGARVQQGRVFAFPVYTWALVLLAVAVLPMSTPVLTPKAWVAYARATHQFNAGSNSENGDSGRLPQFYADRFGWQEEADVIERAYRSLTPEEQARTVILCTNYGEAGAVDFLGRGLPPARSRHNNYFLWGPGELPGEVMILVESTTEEHLHLYFDDVRRVGWMGSPWSMPYERRPIWLLRGPHQTIQDLFRGHKHYI